jgi:hypothetical protein
LMLCRMTVSPERTLLTFASKVDAAMVDERRETAGGSDLVRVRELYTTGPARCLVSYCGHKRSFPGCWRTQSTHEPRQNKIFQKRRSKKMQLMPQYGVGVGESVVSSVDVNCNVELSASLVNLAWGRG